MTHSLQESDGDLEACEGRSSGDSKQQLTCIDSLISQLCSSKLNLIAHLCSQNQAHGPHSPCHVRAVQHMKCVWRRNRQFPAT